MEFLPKFWHDLAGSNVQGEKESLSFVFEERGFLTDVRYRERRKTKTGRHV
jgi:hypothetical protein